VVISAVVLAAGRSSRMGRPKANLPLDADDTFLSRIVRSFRAAGVAEVVVVTGHDAAVIRERFGASGLAARFVENPDYDRGQATSLVRGLDAVEPSGVEAILLTLVDVPLVSPATIRAVIDRYYDTRAPIVRPTSGARHGHPVLIHKSLFAELRGVDPSVGAKSIIRAHASAAGDFPVEDEGAFVDVDTPQEYERLLTGSGGGSG
jgi:molybdenum cofactor cytidylyltransferase